MARPPSREQQAGWARFALGAFTCTAISDGPLDLRLPPRSILVGEDGAAIAGSAVDDLLAAEYLEADGTHLDQNLLLVDTGAHRVLFDAGSGADFGPAAFGPMVGRAPANLRASGVAPEEVDVVCLSHLHPDHCWGLVAGDRPTYPNAELVVPAIEAADLEDRAGRMDAAGMDPKVRAAVIGARRSLAPYGASGRVRHLAHGEEVVPGITARAAPGHSIGHMTYRVESEGNVLMVLADLAHHHVLLLARPEWGTIWDHDLGLAARTRARILREVVDERAAVHAYHFPFPGLGHLQARHGRFRWLPSPLELGDPRQPTGG